MKTSRGFVVTNVFARFFVFSPLFALCILYIIFNVKLYMNLFIYNENRIEQNAYFYTWQNEYYELTEGKGNSKVIKKEKVLGGAYCAPLKQMLRKVEKKVGEEIVYPVKGVVNAVYNLVDGTRSLAQNSNTRDDLSALLAGGIAAPVNVEAQMPHFKEIVETINKGLAGEDEKIYIPIDCFEDEMIGDKKSETYLEIGTPIEYYIDDIFGEPPDTSNADENEGEKLKRWRTGNLIGKFKTNDGTQFMLLRSVVNGEERYVEKVNGFYKRGETPSATVIKMKHLGKRQNDIIGGKYSVKKPRDVVAGVSSAVKSAVKGIDATLRAVIGCIPEMFEALTEKTPKPGGAGIMNAEKIDDEESIEDVMRGINWKKLTDEQKKNIKKRINRCRAFHAAKAYVVLVKNLREMFLNIPIALYVGLIQIIRGLANTPEALINSAKGKVWDDKTRRWVDKTLDLLAAIYDAQSISFDIQKTKEVHDILAAKHVQAYEYIGLSPDCTDGEIGEAPPSSDSEALSHHTGFINTPLSRLAYTILSNTHELPEDQRNADYIFKVLLSNMGKYLGPNSEPRNLFTRDDLKEEKKFLKMQNTVSVALSLKDDIAEYARCASTGNAVDMENWRNNMRAEANEVVRNPVGVNLVKGLANGYGEVAARMSNVPTFTYHLLKKFMYDTYDNFVLANKKFLLMLLIDELLGSFYGSKEQCFQYVVTDFATKQKILNERLALSTAADKLNYLMLKLPQKVSETVVAAGNMIIEDINWRTTHDLLEDPASPANDMNVIRSAFTEMSAIFKDVHDNYINSDEYKNAVNTLKIKGMKSPVMHADYFISADPKDPAYRQRQAEKEEQKKIANEVFSQFNKQCMQGL